LAALLEFDAMRKDLRLKAPHYCESTNRHSVRAINQMTTRNGGVRTKQERWLSIGAVRKELFRCGWESCNPVEASNRGRFLQLEQCHTFANCEMSYAAVAAHNQFIRKDPGQTDSCGFINLVSKRRGQEPAPQDPRYKHTQQLKQDFHITLQAFRCLRHFFLALAYHTFHSTTGIASRAMVFWCRSPHGCASVVTLCLSLRMRTLNIIHSVNPVTGGPIAFIRQLIAFNSSRPNPIEISVLSLDDPEAPWAKDFPGKLHTVKALIPSYGFCPELMSWINRHRVEYDIVVIHGLWQFHSLAAWQSLRKTDTPYVIFTHGMLDPWFGRAYPLKHIKKYLYWLVCESMVLRDARAVLFTSQEECERSRTSFSPYNCRELVVGFGVNVPNRQQETEQKDRFFSQYPELHEKELILFLGRIHEKKGCDLVLSAFVRIADQYPRSHLVMAGPSTNGYAGNLQKRFAAAGSSIAERVSWTGMLSGDLKWGALRAAAALILPSHQENFAMVVAESLGCGTPVLISNRVNTWREIAADSAGFVQSDNLEGTIRLLQRWFAASPKEQEQMSANAMRCFSTRFEIGMVYDRLISAFQQIITAGTT
jgi:glycosyltransferase involved in cell wall biosynthesis